MTTVERKAYDAARYERLRDSILPLCKIRDEVRRRKYGCRKILNRVAYDRARYLNRKANGNIH